MPHESAPCSRAIRRPVGLLLVVALPAVLAARGHAQELPIDLRWTPAPGCPDAAAVLARVRVLAGGDAPARKIRATAVVEQRRERFRVQLRTEIEGHHGERLLEASSCSSLAEATALVLALMANPEATLPPPSAAPSSSVPLASSLVASPSAPPSSLPPPTPSASVESAPVPLASASVAPAGSSGADVPRLPPTSTREPVEGLFRLQAALDGGWAPGFGAGVALGGGARRGPWSVGLDLSWAASRRETLEIGKGGEFSSLGVTLRFCVGKATARWHGEGCALLDESGLRGTGTGISEPASGWRWLLAPGLGVAGGVAIAGPIWGEGALELLLAPRRYTFSIDGQGEIYRTPAAGGRARLGVGVHF